MGKVCRHCGMESDRDKVCSWCNKDLDEPATSAAQSPTPGRTVAPVSAVPVPQPGRTPSMAGAAATAVALEAQRRSRPVWLYVLIGVAAVIVFVLAVQFAAFSKAMKPPVEPAEWKAVTSHTGHLALQVPATWRFSTAGSEGSFESVLVRCGPLCKVSVDAGQARGALSDVAAASARAGGGPAELSLHETLGMFVAKSDTTYKEEGEPQSCTFAGQRAAYSVYTARRRVGLFGAQVRGWRISCPGTDYGYDVRIEAPARHWEKFQPLGAKVVSSVQFAKK
ncbi:MAG: hypothetical protein HPY69_18670 [Armatimonadetes bacterium]|nr:hypothetical protein [Armatimonadota bacterium]